MLKTNSKKARENIRNYIAKWYNDEEQSTKKNEPFQEIAQTIYDCFAAQKWVDSESRRYYKTEQNAFTSWLQGLPSVFDACYYYNRSAKDDLQEILEETAEEANRYTESQAEQTLTYLIWREIANTVDRA